MEQELKDALELMQSNMEGKTKEQIEAEVKAFEEKVDAMIEEKSKDLVEAELKTFKEEIEAERKTALDAMQDHLDNLDIKVNKSGSQKREGNVMDEIKAGIEENFDAIKEVERKGGKHSFEVKVVGDMTLGANLTGDEPRSYSNEVAAVPGHKVNFSDLIGTIPISGGTYTFPREGAGEGAIAFQTEGADKSQRDYDFTMVDVATDFLAGYARYSKKMANNLPFLTGFLPGALRRDYMKQESAEFNTLLAAAATASTEIITGQNKIEMLMAEVATLEASDFDASGIVVPTSDYWDILITEKSTGAGYGLPGVVTLEGGQLRINGIPIYRANWITANKYYVGDWSTISKVVTEGLSVQFSTEDGTNFRSNMITGRVEAQIGLAIHRTDAVIYGDFTAV